MYFRWWVLFSSIQFNFKMHLFDGVHSHSICWTSVNIIVTDHRLSEPWGFFCSILHRNVSLWKQFQIKPSTQHVFVHLHIFWVVSFFFCSLLFLQFRRCSFFFVANYFGWLVGNWPVGIRFVMLLLLMFSSLKILPFLVVANFCLSSPRFWGKKSSHSTPNLFENWGEKEQWF